MINDLINGKPLTVRCSLYQGPNDNSQKTAPAKTYTGNATGYTTKEIQDAAIGCTTWNQWRDKIESKYPSKTDRNNVDTVFSFWFN